MAISNIIERTVDIEAGVKQEDLHRLFAVADAQAHTFKITVTKNGEPQSLSGHTVIGYFMTHFYGTVVINGSVSDNVATLTLPAACYANNVGFQLIIRLVSGSTKTAIYWGSGYVSRSATSPTIDPGSVVPDLDDLLARLDQMDQATQAANTAADNANAAASKSIRYDTAQSLTDAQKAQAQSNIGFLIDSTLTVQGAAADAKKTGDEITALKDDLKDITETEVVHSWVKNKYIVTNVNQVDISSPVSNNTYSYVIVPCSSGDEFTITGSGAVAAVLWTFIDSSGNVLEQADRNATADNLVITAPTNASSLIVNIKNANAYSLYIGNSLIHRINNLEEELSDFSRYHPDYNYLILDKEGYILYSYTEKEVPEEITLLDRYYPYDLIIDKDGYIVFTNKKAEKDNPLKGLQLSIIGDSISTYSGWIPDGYATFYPRDTVTYVTQTWWYKLLSMSEMELCRNASWSGSRVGIDISSATNAYSGASDARISDLTNPDTHETPDVIICYICTNDWGHSTPIGEYSSKMSIPFDGHVTTISEGYALMLYKIRNTYPDAKLYCITHLDGRHSTGGDVDFPIQDDIGQTLHEVNHMIIELAHVFGARVIDLETCGVHPWNIDEYTIDGHLHPNEKGFTLIANEVYRQLVHDFS